MSRIVLTTIGSLGDLHAPAKISVKPGGGANMIKEKQRSTSAGWEVLSMKRSAIEG
ncbi:hypothetical protein [Acaryochloris sp. IP29b_bin.137]|uniref:hypothetical protein n=1 Tax=Acaryochloris sp. IP29b_bin.137 TaxID=2969217 RepID=UPI00262F7E0E|nr:hypothetical protein [Acaryochloris sp. IP29b_bin.137]